MLKHNNIEMEMGAIPSPLDLRDYKATVACAVDLPESFQLDWHVDIKSQSIVGSCVAHSLSELIEYFNYTQEHTKIKMSTNYIYGNRTNSTHKSAGMIVRDAIKAIVDYGDLTYDQFPGNTETPTCIESFEARDTYLDQYAKANRVSTYYTLDDNDAMKVHLMNVGPIVFVVKWPSKYSFSGDNKLLNLDTESFRGYHCMIIYGWNKDGWLFQNSWGNSFGDNGRATWPYDKNIMEVWGVTDSVIGEDQGLILHKAAKWKKIIMKCINFIRKLFNK